MSYPYDDSGGDWNSHTFPYNLSTFTASSNVHPDLPSEPPGYDEFEFSFPSELSPSLFGLPFMSNGKGHGILSPAGSSFPALSTASESPAAWADQYLARSPQQAIAGPSTSISQGVQHQRQDSALIAKKLFEDDERSALDDFFKKTLDESGKPEDVIGEKGLTPPVESVATSSSGGDNVAERPSSTVAPEQRKRTRKLPENTKSVPMKTSKVKRSVAGKSQRKEAHVVAKVEGETNDEEEELGDGPTTAKRVRTDSLLNATSVTMVEAAPSPSYTGPGKRTSHIASEQKRRSTIKDNYKTLVDLLLAGEATSGISLLGGGEDDEDEAENGAKKSKPKGRGRGRKGQDGAGATKSVVLERAADYLRWLDKGNDDLEKEIARLEGVLAK